MWTLQGMAIWSHYVPYETMIIFIRYTAELQQLLQLIKHHQLMPHNYAESLMTLRSTGNPVRTLLTFRCQHFGEQGVTMH
jgi:hypothetical protein